MDVKKKWSSLQHKGPVFAPPYKRIPENVKFYYNRKEMRLSEKAEEVAGLYAKILNKEYANKTDFKNNFFKDWRKVMEQNEREQITDLEKCDFEQMQDYFSSEAKNRTKDEKLDLKRKNKEIQEKYGYYIIDGQKIVIAKFKVEPPALFKGRGNHPKSGMLKRRVEPEDIVINCSEDSIPEPPPGRKWKEVKHNCKVEWLASWIDNVQNRPKYIALSSSSTLKQEKDKQKFETARELHNHIDEIRREYKNDWKSKLMKIRQRAVALYFIDELAFRPGNEKDLKEQADTVGCCSLRVEHISLHKEINGFFVLFNFLGKGSIRYYNKVQVEKQVFRNLQSFMENKDPSDKLFDQLNTAQLNTHLKNLNLMKGLTAKVFRTYNASLMLQQKLDELTKPHDTVSEKMLSYKSANLAVAKLCNHRRSVPEDHEETMKNLKEKIQAKKKTIDETKRQGKGTAGVGSLNLDKLKEELATLEVLLDREENKTYGLDSSKLNYLDPRITVAWCKKHKVPIKNIYNKNQKKKFHWALDTPETYRFEEIEEEIV